MPYKCMRRLGGVGEFIIVWGICLGPFIVAGAMILINGIFAFALAVALVFLDLGFGLCLSCLLSLLFFFGFVIFGPGGYSCVMWCSGRRKAPITIHQNGNVQLSDIELSKSDIMTNASSKV
jgi:hypothetical protein